jgi:hypothetical protein
MPNFMPIIKVTRFGVPEEEPQAEDTEIENIEIEESQGEDVEEEIVIFD